MPTTRCVSIPNWVNEDIVENRPKNTYLSAWVTELLIKGFNAKKKEEGEIE